MMLFTPEEKSMLVKRSQGGIIPRHGGMWYLQEKNGKLTDFGGKPKNKKEVFIETALREFTEESGLAKHNITHVHGVFAGPYYGVIVVDVDKEPVAMEAGSTIVRMKNYSTAGVNGRLFIKDFEYKMRDVEAAEAVDAIVDEDTPGDDHPEFIFDV